MKRKILVLVSVIVLIALTGATAAACTKSDEALVEDLINRMQEAWNNDDYEAMYEMMSPNYRGIVPYSDFEEEQQGIASDFGSLFGTAKVEVTDVGVTMMGTWASARYTVMIGEEVFPMPTDIVDFYRKVEDKWYDVIEEPGDLGYNAEDIPPG